MTQVVFKLNKDFVPGPQKTVVLENPDPHPHAIRLMAYDWAKKQGRYKSVTIEYNNYIETLKLEG